MAGWQGMPQPGHAHTPTQMDRQQPNIIPPAPSIGRHSETAGTDLADGLIFLVDVVVASKQESTVAASAFTSAVVAADDDQVQRVTDAFEVVLLQLSHDDKHHCISAASDQLIGTDIV